MKMSGSCSVLAEHNALTFSCASPQGGAASQSALYTASVPQDTVHHTEFLITLPYTEEEFDLEMQTNFVRGLAAATKFDQPGYGSTKIMNIEPGPPKEYGQDRKPDTVQITARIATTRPKLEKLLEAHDFLGSDFASAANKISPCQLLALAGLLSSPSRSSGGVPTIPSEKSRSDFVAPFSTMQGALV